MGNDQDGGRILVPGQGLPKGRPPNMGALLQHMLKGIDEAHKQLAIVAGSHNMHAVMLHVIKDLLIEKGLITQEEMIARLQAKHRAILSPDGDVKESGGAGKGGQDEQAGGVGGAAEAGGGDTEKTAAGQNVPDAAGQEVAAESGAAEQAGDGAAGGAAGDFDKGG